MNKRWGVTAWAGLGSVTCVGGGVYATATWNQSLIAFSDC